MKNVNSVISSQFSVFSFQFSSFKSCLKSQISNLKSQTAYCIPLFCFLLAAFCFLHSTLSAQNHHSQNFKTEPDKDRKALFGVYFGPTIDWFAPTTDELKRDKAKMGCIGGLKMDVSLTKDKIVYLSTGVFVRYLQGDLAFNNLYNIAILDTMLSVVRPTVRTYQTFYLTIPTAIKFKTKLVDRFIFLGQLGFYHNFRLGGSQFDNFTLSGMQDREFYITTSKISNKDAALFAEAGHVGLGFEYLLGNNTGVFLNLDYGCQFNYFSAKAKNNVTEEQLKAIIHSFHIVFGFSF